MSNKPTLPASGSRPHEVLERMRDMAAADADWRGGRTFSLVYHAGDEHTRLVQEAQAAFLHENGLGMSAFGSLRRFESEVLDMVAGLFHGPEAKGSLTTGGSESILMVVKAAREWARANRPEVTAPCMVVPLTVHPAFEKAAHYFGVRIVHAPVGADHRVDIGAVRELVDADTILIVGSAPQYPHGVIDGIAALAALAQEQGILCHVDACVGGFFLPFAEKLGRPVPPWDFRVPGVTSISADLHKYGYAAKGASVVMYRDASLRRFQFFQYVDWPGGVYASPTATGTRAGGAIAAAWAALHHLGLEGYLDLTRRTLDATDRLQQAARDAGLRVLGVPDMSVFAVTSDSVDIYAVADGLTERGWHLDRQHAPPSLHLTVSAAHTQPGVVERFASDLKAVVDGLANDGPASEGSAALYGLMATLPDREAVGGIVLEFMDGIYQAESGA